MKKLFLFATTLLFALCVSSAQKVMVVKCGKNACHKEKQEGCCSNGFKATQGDVTADFSIFSEGLLNKPFAVQALKGRYFLTDQWALRGELTLQTNKTNNQSYTDTGVVTDEAKKGISALRLGLGTEYHFAGTHRLSPYVGGGILFSTDRKIASQMNQSSANVSTKVVNEGPNQWGLGCGLFFGADYYIAKHVYVGAEAGWGLLYTRTAGNTITTTTNGSTMIQKTNQSQSSWAGENLMNAGFKIGFTF